MNGLQPPDAVKGNAWKPFSAGYSPQIGRTKISLIMPC